MDPNEKRVVDPTTGGEKGSKPERFDLIPPKAMEEVARVYGQGAEKYTRKEPVSKWLLEQLIATRLEDTMLVVSADPVTKSSFVFSTLTSRSGNELTVELGGFGTPDRRLRLIVDIDETPETAVASLYGNVPGNWPPSVSLSMTRWFYSIVKGMAVESVADPLEVDGFTWITITRPESFGVFCVENATRDLAFSEILQRGSGKQSHTLNRVEWPNVLLSGERNWEKGYNWGLSLAALERHLAKFKARESRDELGNHHLACVAFHALALMTFEKYNLGTDDRSALGSAPAESAE